MKILISGGHLTPALAIIDYIQTHQYEDEIVYVGRIYSQEKNKQLSVELDEIEKRQGDLRSKRGCPGVNVKFISLSAAKLRNFSLFKFIKSVLYSYKIIRREKPDVFLSFGGFVAIPLACAAYFARVPIITHEQTRSVGKANKFVAKFAKIVALSFADSKKYFPGKKTKVIGNPIREKIYQKEHKKPNWFNKTGQPLLLVMGGNQGSLIINNTIKESLSSLLADYSIVHACGRATKLHHYKQELLDQAALLSQPEQDRYYVREWLSDDELFYFYQQADLAISRAGANTVHEIAIANVPTIFIPLPFAHHDEQRLNAKWLVNQKAALILEQEKLSVESLKEQIDILAASKKELITNLKQIEINRTANKELYYLLQQLAAKTV